MLLLGIQGFVRWSGFETPQIATDGGFSSEVEQDLQECKGENYNNGVLQVCDL